MPYLPLPANEMKPGEIFVFGSNLAGRHGAGAAKEAMMRHGAILFQGEGLQGRSYGLPTKGHRIETLTLDRVAKYVSNFKEFARSRPDLKFFVTPVGCGLAGYKRAQIKPLFRDMPDNCRLSKTWGEEYGP